MGGWASFSVVVQVSGSIALSVRGDCSFMKKAQVAQAGGATALLVINNEEGCCPYYICDERRVYHLSILSFLLIWFPCNHLFF